MAVSSSPPADPTSGARQVEAFLAKGPLGRSYIRGQLAVAAVRQLETHVTVAYLRDSRSPAGRQITTP